MRVGDSAGLTRVFGTGEVTAFAEALGVAAGAQVPEPLLAAMFSRLLGVDLPGPGTRYLKQELRFVQPAPVGVVLRARVEVTRWRAEKRLVDLATVILAPDGGLICAGRALVLAPTG